MNKTLHLFRNTILLLILCLGTARAQSGLFEGLVAIKAKAESSMAAALKNPALSPAQKQQLLYNFIDVQIAADQLITRLQADLNSYDGIIGSRTIRNIKKTDRAIMDSKLSSPNYHRSIYLKLYNNLKQEYQLYDASIAASFPAKIAGGGPAGIKSFGLTDYKGIVDWALDLRDKFRGENKIKSDGIKELLEKLRINIPVS